MKYKWKKHCQYGPFFVWIKAVSETLWLKYMGFVPESGICLIKPWTCFSRLNV